MGADRVEAESRVRVLKHFTLFGSLSLSFTLST